MARRTQNRNGKLAYESCVSFKLARKDRLINMNLLKTSKKIVETSNCKKLKRDIGIVEKAQETSSDTGIHNTVCLFH